MNARTPRRLVVALGGHAIVPHGAAGTAEQQVATIERAMAEVATQVFDDRLVILTDVEGVAVDFGGARQRWLDGVGTTELRELVARGTFGVGSMAPKVEAALRFVEATGHPATIGPRERAADVLDGRSGTQVTPSAAMVGAER